jgi:hypothetical protein
MSVACFNDLPENFHRGTGQTMKISVRMASLCKQRIIFTVSQIWRRRTNYLCPGGVQFESSPGHRLSWLMYSRIFSVPP